MKYYFAYGSNLNMKQMQSRCPKSKMIGKSKLDGYRLLFRKHSNRSDGVLTIEKADGKAVPIGIFQISSSDEKALDKCEGVATYCYGKEYIECCFNGETKKGLVYIMLNPSKAVPSPAYYERVKQGYKDFEFDICYLEESRQECQN